MLNLILAAGMVFSSISFAAPEDCQRMAGYYAAIPETYPGYDPAVLAIDYSVAANAITLKYGVTDESRYRYERYQMDGAQNEGDGRWSGDTYVAVCDREGLTITKTFRQLKGPIVSTLTLSEEVLSENLEHSGYSRLQGRYLRIRGMMQ